MFNIDINMRKLVLSTKLCLFLEKLPFLLCSAESHLEYTRAELVNVSWYNLLHWDSIRTAYCKHQTGMLKRILLTIEE